MICRGSECAYVLILSGKVARDFVALLSHVTQALEALVPGR